MYLFNKISKLTYDCLKFRNRSFDIKLLSSYYSCITIFTIHICSTSRLSL